MRARAKRRLAIGTVAAVIIVGAVVVFVVAWSGSSGRNGSQSQTSKEVFGTFGAFGISSGMHGRELAARLGEPDQKRNSCWIYRIHGKSFHGIKIVPQTAGMDAVRYCFFSGVVAIIEDHWRKVNGKDPYPEPWTAPITFGCGSRPCQHLAP